MRARTVVVSVLMSSVGLAAEPVTAVVVAAVDLPAGSVLTMETVSQRVLPTEHVTRSMVKPDSASYVIGRRTRFPIVAQEPVLWTYVESRHRFEACGVLEKDERAEVQVARHRQVLRTRRAKTP
jgi:pilus assembly protein CpaB